MAAKTKLKTIDDLINHAFTVQKNDPFSKRIKVYDSLYNPDINIEEIIVNEVSRFTISEENHDTAYMAAVNKINDILGDNNLKDEDQFQEILEEYLDFFLEKASGIVGTEHKKKIEKEKEGSEGRYERLRRKAQAYDQIVKSEGGGIQAILRDKEAWKNVLGEDSTPDEVKKFFNSLAKSAVNSYSGYILNYITDHLIQDHDQYDLSTHAEDPIREAGYEFKSGIYGQPLSHVQEAYQISARRMWNDVDQGKYRDIGLKKHKSNKDVKK